MSKSFVRSIKNVANGYSSAQVLVRKATSNDPTGPTTYDMEEIASYTYQSQTDFLEIMDMLDRRLNDKGKNWRHVAKSLTVLDYLVRYGSEKCVLWSKDNLYIIKTLREFIHLDENNNDQGAIIRVKAKEFVSLLKDDERLRQEREAATRSQNGNQGGGERRNRRSRRNTLNSPRPRNDDPYDAELQKALELSRLTADEENRRLAEDNDDPDLQAALKLSMEEEEMRKVESQQNNNLLDLDDSQQQPQYYMTTGYYQQQPVDYYQQQVQQQQQFDMFGNPIQSSMTGLYPQQTYYQQPQYQQPNQFTGFNYGQPQQQQQPQEQLQPLKTGSNNPFALSSETQPKPQTQSLNELQQQQQPQFFTQPVQQQQPQQIPQIKRQTTSSSKFNDETHSELNDLLAQGTGIDTFGNVGASRIPHQHTKTQNFINSSGTGYKQNIDQQNRLSSNATGNPFLNTGIGYQQQAQPQQQQYQQQPQQINPAYTGYGFGNAQQQQPQQQRYGNDGPSLIDI
ncbi:uncharacterized protein RJT20DRAFT_59849 [Scheffersomyces xylosifermentans]|uniref:uncharacterized protein n=1 Tax=Scheffersomyces xylosifermentans TaxID=1304137 RepID=UPI00315DF11E